jgi:hypothetical protein
LKIKKILFVQNVIIENKRVSVSQIPVLFFSEKFRVQFFFPTSCSCFEKAKGGHIYEGYNIPIYLFLCLLGRAIQNNGMGAVKN